MSLFTRTHEGKALKVLVLLSLPSRVIIILLNFQNIAEYYEKNRNKKFPSEILRKSHDPYYILKVSAQMD